MSPLSTALVAQVFGGIIATAIIQLVHPPLFSAPLAFAGIQGCCAALTSHKLEAPPWWLPIHLAFMPAVILAGRLPVAPGWYLAAFAALLLVFWRTDKSRVPLYLSNAATAEAVAALIPGRPCHVIDLGCGTGGLLRRLARARPDCEFLGVEHAPIPWAWAKVSAASLPNVRVRLGSFWSQHLGLFEMAYAFLSPAPMAGIQAKAAEEMRPGALFVSNSFPMPGLEAERVVEVGDGRRTHLYCYRPAG